MKIYISGKMSGLPDNNYPKFDEVENDLLNKGFTVVNPARLPHDHNKTYGEFMREDLKALLECDTIFMIDGWRDSKGAMVEHAVAVSCGFTVYVEGEL